jgi:hypothetical protein
MYSDSKGEMHMNNWQVLIEQNTTLLLAVSLGAVVILFFLLIVLWTNLLSFKKKFKLLMKGASGENIEAKLQEHLVLAEQHRELANSNLEKMNAIEKNFKQCVQHVGVKRYNAFEDIGSRLSYSIALLDDELDGVILTGIYGRHESTTYAKAIRHGISEQHLSVEEMDAMQMAKEKHQKRANP